MKDADPMRDDNTSNNGNLVMKQIFATTGTAGEFTKTQAGEGATHSHHGATRLGMDQKVMSLRVISSRRGGEWSCKPGL